MKPKPGIFFISASWPLSNAGHSSSKRLRHGDRPSATAEGCGGCNGDCGSHSNRSSQPLVTNVSNRSTKLSNHSTWEYIIFSKVLILWAYWRSFSDSENATPLFSAASCWRWGHRNQTLVNSRPLRVPVKMFLNFYPPVIWDFEDKPPRTTSGHEQLVDNVSSLIFCRTITMVAWWNGLISVYRVALRSERNTLVVSSNILVYLFFWCW